ncbi:hypothetical protein [Agrobacterium tumefaciens]|uniref:hypothetical protein n=1 Tax=Agrobacterium tumefaciens TaxID=358 RepID=UPI001571E9A6|nr:hypothetical protein [Agrobacterium tumefaciens]NTE35214.1 hypothetical protein [Agrobacterium tumefaciens]NTE50724.1 hypothetical protein [Agrobacterium tumefaciens]
MPEKLFTIAPFTDCDPRDGGRPETGFSKRFSERRLSPEEATDDARERDCHTASPETKLLSGHPSVRVADNILVKSSFKVPVPSLCRVNEIFFNKAGHLPAGPSRLIQKENLRNRSRNVTVFLFLTGLTPFL